MILILFGFKRCGKTLLGQQLATRLGYRFIDTDALLHQEMGMSCRAIVQEHGADYFRWLECQKICGLRPNSPTILSLGAGAIFAPATLEHLQKIGRLIYLRLDYGTLKKRLLEPPLPYYIDPLDPETTFDLIYQERILYYERIAETTVNLEGRSPQEVLWHLTDLAHFFASQHGENPMEKRSEWSSMAARLDLPSAKRSSTRR